MLLLGLSVADATEEKDHVSLRFVAGAAVWVCRVRPSLSRLSGALWAESMLYAVIGTWGNANAMIMAAGYQTAACNTTKGEKERESRKQKDHVREEKQDGLQSWAGMVSIVMSRSHTARMTTGADLSDGPAYCAKRRSRTHMMAPEHANAVDGPTQDPGRLPPIRPRRNWKHQKSHGINDCIALSSLLFPPTSPRPHGLHIPGFSTAANCGTTPLAAAVREQAVPQFTDSILTRRIAILRTPAVHRAIGEMEVDPAAAK